MDAPAIPPCTLSFGCTDPCGGSGLQADLLTFASIGCHALSVVTAVTVQDTVGVDQINAMDADFVNEQARALLEDIEISAFKLGVLGSIENIAVIAEIVADYPDVPLIIDPILTSGRGDELCNDDMMIGMSELLFPQATVMTPNSIEARRLAFDDDEVMQTALDASAERLLAMGAEYVLITGTHERTTPVNNQLYGHGGFKKTYEWQRLPGSYHGAGCTLSSAITACLAHGLSIEEAMQEAQSYTWQTLKQSFRPGMGQLLPDRLFWARETENNS